jgi:predicted DNA-binding transcriptional regulator AlpA
MSEADRLWTLPETAAYLVVPERTLYAWRARGEGPPAAKVGRHLRYDPAKVRAWVESRTDGGGWPALLPIARLPSLRQSGRRGGRSSEAPSAGKEARAGR